VIGRGNYSIISLIGFDEAEVLPKGFVKYARNYHEDKK
jgi:hypothetical protein